MKVLICGTGKIARELVKRLEEKWEIGIIEKSEMMLHRMTSFYPFIQKCIIGDASSHVVLEEAGVADQEYVLALTNDDKVNLEICAHAHEKGVNHILARVHDPEKESAFRDLGVKTILVNTMIARTIHHYLQDSRVFVTPMGLGRGEILEVDVSGRERLIGRRVMNIGGAQWRVTAVLRGKELLFPDFLTKVQAEDRLVIIGKFEGFESMCKALEFNELDFPMAYGRGMLLAVPPKKNLDEQPLISEGVHFTQNTGLRHVVLLGSQADDDLEERFSDISQGIDVRFETAEASFLGRLIQLCSEGNIGMAVIPPFETSFLKGVTKSRSIELAHSLPCPLLISRNCWPYERILVPFNATPMARRALEAAVNLARQIHGRITAIVVQEPEFIQGSPDEDWAENSFRKVRELAHVHKIRIEEEVRRGNPVKEVVEATKNFDLVVLGSTTREGSLFSPHIGDLIASGADCTVLVIAS